MQNLHLRGRERDRWIISFYILLCSLLTLTIGLPFLLPKPSSVSTQIYSLVPVDLRLRKFTVGDTVGVLKEGQERMGFIADIVCGKGLDSSCWYLVELDQEDFVSTREKDILRYYPSSRFS